MQNLPALVHLQEILGNQGIHQCLPVRDDPVDGSVKQSIATDVHSFANLSSSVPHGALLTPPALCALGEIIAVNVGKRGD